MEAIRMVDAFPSNLEKYIPTAYQIDRAPHALNTKFVGASSISRGLSTVSFTRFSVAIPLTADELGQLTDFYNDTAKHSELPFTINLWDGPDQRQYTVRFESGNDIQVTYRQDEVIIANFTLLEVPGV